MDLDEGVGIRPIDRDRRALDVGITLVRSGKKAVGVAFGVEAGWVDLLAVHFCTGDSLEVAGRDQLAGSPCKGRVAIVEQVEEWEEECRPLSNGRLHVVS